VTRKEASWKWPIVCRTIAVKRGSLTRLSPFHITGQDRRTHSSRWLVPVARLLSDDRRRCGITLTLFCWMATAVQYELLYPCCLPTQYPSLCTKCNIKGHCTDRRIITDQSSGPNSAIGQMCACVWINNVRTKWAMTGYLTRRFNLALSTSSSKITVIGQFSRSRGQNVLFLGREWMSWRDVYIPNRGGQHQTCAYHIGYSKENLKIHMGTPPFHSSPIRSSSLPFLPCLPSLSSSSSPCTPALPLEVGPLYSN